MWPRPIILLGFLLLVALACANPPRAAVAFVDVKFDDKVAIWSLLLDQRYDRVIAITSGVGAHGEAAAELEEYLEAQNEIAKVRFPVNKIQILRGTNPLPKPPPHEKWWGGRSQKATTFAGDAALRRALHGYEVAVFQIAPTTPEQVQTVIKAADPGSIKTYFLLHGYNSRQSDMATQTNFLRSLRSWVIEQHPNAEVYLSSSFDSYPAKNGGKQPLESIAGMVPQRDVEQALRDPFWSSQLLRAYKQGYALAPFPITDQRQLDEMIYDARMHPLEHKDFRDLIVKYIQEKVVDYRASGQSEPPVVRRLRYTHVPEFTGGTTLELADANHIAAFHRFLDQRRASGMSVKNVVYPAGPHPEGATVDFVEANGSDHHGKMLQGADTGKDLEFIKQLARFAA
jgi:hypothetical protein